MQTAGPSTETQDDEDSVMMDEEPDALSQGDSKTKKRKAPAKAKTKAAPAASNADGGGDEPPKKRKRRTKAELEAAGSECLTIAAFDSRSQRSHADTGSYQFRAALRRPRRLPSLSMVPNETGLALFTLHCSATRRATKRLKLKSRPYRSPDLCL